MSKTVQYTLIGIIFVLAVLFFPALAIGKIAILIALLGPFAVPVAIILLIMGIFWLKEKFF